MRLEEFNLFNIKSRKIKGFSIFSFKFSKPIKGLDPKYTGIRDYTERCLLGLYVFRNKYITIHAIFYKKRFKINTTK